MERPTGTWWRFERYEVRDGYIRPARGAACRSYDPWGPYWKTTRSSTSIPPHLQLARLVRGVRTDKPASMLYRAGDEYRALVKGIAEFCQQYGLLGLLPHRVLFARLGGRREFLRTPAGWKASSISWEPDDLEPPETLISFDGDELVVDDAREWHRFFRHLDPNRWQKKNPPLPPSEAFWAHYQEPLAGFIAEARAFASAVELLAEGGPSRITELDGAILDRAGALARLHTLMGGVGPALQATRRGHRLTWEAPSLLGHLAMQAAHDLVGDRRTVRCKCGTSFSTGHWRGRFCSERCANRERQRLKRKRDRLRSPARRRRS